MRKSSAVKFTIESSNIVRNSLPKQNLENAWRRTQANDEERSESWRDVGWRIKINESAHSVGAVLGIGTVKLRWCCALRIAQYQ